LLTYPAATGAISGFGRFGKMLLEDGHPVSGQSKDQGRAVHLRRRVSFAHSVDVATKYRTDTSMSGDQNPEFGLTKKNAPMCHPRARAEAFLDREMARPEGIRDDPAPVAGRTTCAWPAAHR
jgi:hypothetical protein